MTDEERDPYSWDVVEIGMLVGHIAALSSVKRRTKKHPIGFAPPLVPPRKPRGSRKPGSWPDVPFFDERGEA